VSSLDTSWAKLPPLPLCCVHTLRKDCPVHVVHLYSNRHRLFLCRRLSLCSLQSLFGLEHQLLLYPSSCCLVRPVSSGSGQSSWTGGDLSRSFGAVFGGEEEAWVAVARIACARSSPWRERDFGSRAQFIRAASWCVSDLKSQFG
jgi:hypothetical protein